MKSENKLLLLDTFYFLHRSFRAYPKDLKSPAGENTNIVFGFAQALLDSIAEFNPTHIACGWESEEQPSFRKELFPQYQITRVPMEIDDERIFIDQLPRIIQLIETFNIPRLMENGFEGDDVLGTAATIASKYANVIISTADQDLLQLITDKIFVFRPARPPHIKKELFDENKFIGKYGFKPQQMIDYKALRGDPSDNIPGVRGIGDKNAKLLIGQFGSLKAIYDGITDVKSVSVRKKLEVGKEAAFISKQLATIITDIPMHFDLEECKVHNFDVNEVRSLFYELGFNSLNKRLDRFNEMEVKKNEKVREELAQGRLF